MATTKKTVKKAAPKAKKPAVKKVASRPAPKKKAPAKRTANAKFMAPVTPSSLLAEIVGNKPMPRTEVTKKLWGYIKKNGLQDKKNKRNINADAKLKPIFKKPQVSMFEMTKLISKQLS